MQLTKHIGCLLALAFAAVSAFAGTAANGSQWFTATVEQTLSSPWTIGEGGAWTWNTTYGSFKGQLDDANTELVYTPASAGEDKDETICTKVKFTAMDIADAQMLEVPSGAKAGLTLVEDENGALAYWGVVNTNSEGVLGWVPLSGANLLSGKSSSNLAEVEVKVALFKDGENVYANYTIAGEALKYNNSANIPLTATEPLIASIAYRGMCDLWNLSGLAWSNDPTVPSTVEISGEGCPTTPIAYNHQELKLLIGDDADDEEKVATYFKTPQENGQLGWVNYALGIDGTVAANSLNVQSNKCVEGSVALDFGFVVAKGHEVLYKIDTDTKGKKDAAVEETTGIHTVKIVVDDVEVASKSVGVMVTGKEPTDAQKEAETPTNVFDIVAVPFEAFQGEVYVANLLNTADLNAGDKLYIHNGEGYDTFVLEAGAWKAEGATSYSREKATKTLDPADQYELTAGQAIWIERNPNSKIVFAGKGEIDVSHTWTWDPVAKQQYSLVANPTINDFVLTGKTFGGIGDTIVVEDVANPQQFEKTADGWGEWKVVEYMNKRGKTGTKLQWTAGGTIKAGIGFWYYKKDAGAAEPDPLSIDFGKNVTPAPTPVE